MEQGREHNKRIFKLLRFYGTTYTDGTPYPENEALPENFHDAAKELKTRADILLARLHLHLH